MKHYRDPTPALPLHEHLSMRIIGAIIIGILVVVTVYISVVLR